MGRKIEEELMRRMIRQSLKLVLIAACLPLWAVSMRAQEGKLETAPSKEPKLSTVYRVDYTIRETEDGKVLNSRKYVLMAMTHQRGDNWTRSRVGNRVPIMGEKGVQYENVGMEVDCRVEEQDDLIVLESVIDLSSIVPREQAPGPGFNNPVLRTVHSQVKSVVSLGKPTVIGVIDDVTSNRRFEIEATVTQVK
jgi:hypothetical protein